MNLESNTKSLEYFFKTYISATEILEHRNPEVVITEHYYSTAYKTKPDQARIFIFFDNGISAVAHFNQLISKYSHESAYFDLQSREISEWLDTYKSEVFCYNIKGCSIALSKGVSFYRIDISVENDYTWLSINSVNPAAPVVFTYPFTSPVKYNFPVYEGVFNVTEAIMLLAIVLQIQYKKAMHFIAIDSFFNAEDLKVFTNTKDFKSFAMHMIFNVFDKNRDYLQAPILEGVFKTLVTNLSKFELLELSYKLLMCFHADVTSFTLDNNILKVLSTKVPKINSVHSISLRINKYFKIQDGEFILYVALQNQLQLAAPYLENYMSMESFFDAMLYETDDMAVLFRKQLMGDMPINLEDRPTTLAVKKNYLDSNEKNYKQAAIDFNNSAIHKVKTQDYEGAIIDFQKAIKEDANILPAYLTLSSLKINHHQDFKYVVALLDDFLLLEGYEKNPDPLYASLYFNRGLAKSYLELEEEAILDFTEALNINPNYAESYGGRAFSLMQLNENVAALDDYNKALELNNDSPIEYYNRSKCKQALNDYIGSLEDCEIALKMDPDNLAIQEHKLLLDVIKKSGLWDMLNGINLVE